MSSENRPLDIVEGDFFCMKCGKRLIAEVTPADKPIEDVATEADRRLLTVMSCDLVGSTPVSEKLVP